MVLIVVLSFIVLTCVFSSFDWVFDGLNFEPLVCILFGVGTAFFFLAQTTLFSAALVTGWVLVSLGWPDPLPCFLRKKKGSGKQKRENHGFYYMFLPFRTKDFKQKTSCPVFCSFSKNYDTWEASFLTQRTPIQKNAALQVAALG